MILHRYILGQVLWPVLAALFSINLLFLVVQLLKVGELAMGAGLSLWGGLRLSALFLPGFSVLTVPISVLTGVLLGLGRMASDGEITAVAGAGISFHRLALMPLGVGLVAATAAGVVANTAAPHTSETLHRTLVELSKRQVVASLSPGQFFEEIPGMVLFPLRPGEQPGAWSGFMLYDQRPQRTRQLVLARRARLEPRPGGNFLELELQDGEVHGSEVGSGLYRLARFERATVGVDIDRLVELRTRFIPETERMSLGQLAAAARDPWSSERERQVSASAWHRRFAFPAATLLFAWLGVVLVAFGRLRGRRRTLLAAVGVVALYYLLMRFGDAVVQQGWLGPAVAAWMPDGLVAGVVGLGMLRPFRRSR